MALALPGATTLIQNTAGSAAADRGTAMCWVMAPAVGAAQDFLLWRDYTVYLAGDGTLSVYNSTAEVFSTTVLVAKRWYHIAITANGSGANLGTLYISGVQELTFTTNTASRNLMGFGVSPTAGNNPAGITVAGGKFFHVPLNDAQRIRQEMVYWDAVHAGCRFWSALDGSVPHSLIDRSAWHYNLTASGTATTQQPGPAGVSYRSGPSIATRVNVAAAGGFQAAWARGSNAIITPSLKM